MGTHSIPADYATLQAWHDAERNTTDPEGAIVRLPAGSTLLTANFQFRHGTAAAYTVTAEPGAECVGDIRTATLPSIATLDAGGNNLDFRENNVIFLNMHVRDFDFTTTGDSYNDLTFDTSVIDGYFNMTNVSSNVNFTDTVAVQHPGDANGNINKVVDLQGAVGMTALRSTFINAAGGVSAANACVFLRTSAASSFNQCVIYSPTNPCLRVDSGIAPTGSANNAANDATWNAYGGVTTAVTAVDFLDYAARDYRLKSESVPALLGTQAGAFIQAVVDQDPQLDTPVPDIVFAIGEIINEDLGQHFSDPNLGDTLTFSITSGTLPTGMNLSTSGFLTSNGSENITGETAFTITASDGAGPTASDEFTITITAVVPKILDIDGDNIVLAGQTGVVINGSDLDVNPSTQIILLGGAPLTVTDWSTDDPVVTIPQEISLNWGQSYTLTVEGDNGVVTFATQVMLNKPALWSIMTFDGSAIPVDTVGTETIQEHVPLDATTGNITLALNDIFAFETTAGLTINNDGSVEVSPAGNISIPYKIWDISANAWTALSTLNITNAGAAPAPAQFSGTIPTQNFKEGTALVGVGFTAFWSNMPDSYLITTGVLPDGLTLNLDGSLTGTPTVDGTFAVVITASNSDGGEASNSFDMVVSKTYPPTFTGSLPDRVNEIGDAISISITGPWRDEEAPLNDPDSYVVTAGQLPAGVSLLADGTLTGTVSAIGVSAGIRITGTNEDGVAVSNEFAWSVTAASNNPVISEQFVEGGNGTSLANESGIKVVAYAQFGGTPINTTPVTFSTDSAGNFSVPIVGLTLGVTYWCAFENANGTIQELHKMLAKAP